MAGPVGPLMYGIFAAAAMGARTGAALRHVLIKLGTKAADTATKQGRLVKKIDMSIKKMKMLNLDLVLEEDMYKKPLAHLYKKFQDLLFQKAVVLIR